MRRNPDSERCVRVLVDLVAAETGVAAIQILGRSQRQDIVAVRQLAMYLADRHLGASLAGIGRALGRDHSTVLYGVRQIRSRLDADPALAEQARRIADVLRREMADWARLAAEARRQRRAEAERAAEMSRRRATLSVLAAAHRRVASGGFGAQFYGDDRDHPDALRTQNERFLAHMRAALAAERTP